MPWPLSISRRIGKTSALERHWWVEVECRRFCRFRALGRLFNCRRCHAWDKPDIPCSVYFECATRRPDSRLFRQLCSTSLPPNIIGNLRASIAWIVPTPAPLKARRMLIAVSHGPVAAVASIKPFIDGIAGTRQALVAAAATTRAAKAAASRTRKALAARSSAFDWGRTISNLGMSYIGIVRPPVFRSISCVGGFDNESANGVMDAVSSEVLDGADRGEAA